MFGGRRSRSSPSALQSRLRDQRSRAHGETRPTSLSSSSHTSYMPGAPASRWPTRPDPPRGADPCPTRRRCGDAARRAQRRRVRARPTRCSRGNLRSTRRGLVSLRHAPLGGVPGRLIRRRLYREPPPDHDRTSGRDALSRGRPSLGAGPRMAIERRETPERWRSGGSSAGRNAGARAALGPESLPTRKETHLAGSGPILSDSPRGRRLSIGPLSVARCRTPLLLTA